MRDNSQLSNELDFVLHDDIIYAIKYDKTHYRTLYVGPPKVKLYVNYFALHHQARVVTSNNA